MTVFLLIFIFMSGGAAADMPPASGPGNHSSDGYIKVAETGKLALYADMNSGLFELHDGQTEKRWYSTPPNAEEDMITKGSQRMDLRSQLVIEYIYKEDESKSERVQTANSQIACVMEDGITVTQIKSGIRVLYDFKSTGISVPVEYTLLDGYLNASVDIKGIYEKGDCFLTAVNLLPTFGAGSWEDDGYLFVPDGCGAIINFNNQVLMPLPYESMIYGSELAVPAETRTTKTQTVRLPVFGTVTGNNALMGVVTTGDGAASITAINGNERCGYNAASSKAHFRMLSTKYNLYSKKEAGKVSAVPFGLDTYEVRYYPLNGEKASYTGMAAAYREYLIREKGLEKNITLPSFHVDLLGAIETKGSFIGISYTKRQALTTFAQAKKILEFLKAYGIDSISARYRGWSNNGLENKKLPVKAVPLGVLGGTKEFNIFRQYMSDNKYELYPDTDFLTFRKNGNGISKNSDSARTVFRQTVYLYSYMPSVYERVLEEDPARLLTANKLADVALRYLSSAGSQDLSHLSLGTLGDLHYSNLDAKKQDYRSIFSASVENVLKKYKDTGISLSFEGGNAYVLPYAGLIINPPVSSSGYDSFDADVPFYQTVLHGYINYTTAPVMQSHDPELTLLTAVQTGSELLYSGMYGESGILRDTKYNSLYSSSYKLWAEDAARAYKEYSPILKKIYDKEITSCTKAAENVFVTTYANKIKVAVNYSLQPVELDGKTVPARGFYEWEEEV